LKTALFDFQLPDALIATVPPSPRGSSRLLVISPERELQDLYVQNLPDFLQSGDVLVLNDTKVIPARLKGVRGAAKVEFLLHRQMEQGIWQVFAKPAKRLRIGDYIAFADGFSAEIIAKENDGQVQLNFHCSSEQLFKKLDQYGEIPLPPYIQKKRKAGAEDKQNYQTIYADDTKAASVAAPTAGLHFTPELFAALKQRGVQIVYVTLHVGAGTFLPVKVEDTKDHVMHAEYAEISAETAALINQAKARGGRVVAVGTTSMRTLESATDANGQVQPMARTTDIFITPSYQFKCVDMLMTNFHLPKSTLFMLVSAFSGLEMMQRAYQHAIRQQYRFYSYGDACLLYRQAQA
jgi:S-adenosylmethionine:tRNA ribosyltransferase-isomerase